MKRIVILFLLCISLMASAEESRLVVITADGVRTEYALRTFRKIVPSGNETDPLKTIFSDGSQSDNAHTVAFTVADPIPFEEGDVDVKTTESTAEFSWPSITGAGGYKLVIYADEACTKPLVTLTFNSQGYLTNINFNGMLQSVQTPLAFTVTGLEQGTEYYYELAATDEIGIELYSQQGEFLTQGTKQGLGELSLEGVQLYTHNKTIVVDAEEAHGVAFFDINGHPMGKTVLAKHTECIVPLSGVYLVKIDGKTYKVIIH